MLNDDLFRTKEIDIDFKRDLSKVIDSKLYFHEKDRFTSVFICNLKMGDKYINLSDCNVRADVMVNEDDYTDTRCLETKIIDETYGKVVFGLSEELMIAGTKRFQVHIDHGEQILVSPMVSYTIIKGL